jgi:Cyclic nucleotide-binding domain/Major Facilitator Superfamily
MIHSVAIALSALRRALSNPDIRRAELGWMTGWAAEWAWLVALFVFAFEAGGLTAVGLVGLARTLPAAVLAPAISSLTDRLPRHRVLLGVHRGRALLIGLAAFSVAVGWSPLVVYVIAPLDALLAVLHRPTHMSLMPSLARSPEELVAANVASSTLEAIGILAGPAIGGLLVATDQAALAFAVPAAAFGVAAGIVAGIRPGQQIWHMAEQAGLRSVLLGGVRALAEYPHAALLLSLFGAQTLVRGILSVLLVVASIELLGLGEGGVGYLNAALGAGGLIGALAAVALVGRARLAPSFFMGLVLWGAPILVLGLVPQAGVALLSMGAVGAGNAMLDVAGFSLVQRSVPNAVRGRVFGMLEAIVMLTVGVGAALAPILVALLDVQGALIATGLMLPVLALVSWPRVSAADAHAIIPARELGLLRGVPMLRLLPLTVLEQLATELTEMRFSDGAEVIRQGEVGDRFYIVAEGAADVSVDGRVVRRMLPGDSYGEIALLRDVPRTASVTAEGDLVAFAVERDAFLAAVTGDRESHHAAEAVIGDRLGSGAPGT